MRISGKIAMELTQQLMPYLIVKKDVAMVFLKYPLEYKKGLHNIADKVFNEMREIHLNLIPIY